MLNPEIGEVIARRELKLAQDGREPADVIVLIGRPRQLPGHADFYCPYQIKGINSEKVRHIYGIDELQALLLAIFTLATELDALNKELGGKLCWELAAKGLGLPCITPADI